MINGNGHHAAKISAGQQTLLALAILIGIVACGLTWAQYAFDRQIDLGNKPVSVVFQRVLRSAVPPGVSNVRIAGMASLSGQVWIRFHSSNVHRTLTILLKNPGLSISGPNSQADESTIESKGNRYATAVGWGDLAEAAKPEYYDFRWNPNQGQGWFGIIVVDRQRGDFYINGTLL